MNENNSGLSAGEEPAAPADEASSLPADEETGGLFPLPAGEAEEQCAVSANEEPSAASDANWNVVFQENVGGKRDTQKEAALARRLKRQQKAEPQQPEPRKKTQFSQRGRTQETDAAVQKARPILPAVIIGILLLLCIALCIMLFYTRSQMNDPNGTADLDTSDSAVLDFPDDIAPATRAVTVTAETTLTAATRRQENIVDEPKKQTAKTENTSEQTETVTAASTNAPAQTQAPASGGYIPPVQTPAVIKPITTKTTPRTTTTTTTTTQLIMTTTAAPVSANMMLIADSVYAQAGQKQVPVNIWVRNNGGYANSTVRVIHTPGIVPDFDRYGDPLVTKGNTALGAMSTNYSANAYTLAIATISGSAVSGDGSYATLYFDVPAGAAPGTVYYLAVYPDNFGDVSSTPLLCEGHGGAIIVY